MLHAGIDMHKEFLMVTVLDEEGNEVVSPRRIPTGGLSIQEFFSRFEPEEIAAVLEAGLNWYWLCDQLDELGIQNRLCHPLKTSKKGTLVHATYTPPFLAATLKNHC